MKRILWKQTYLTKLQKLLCLKYLGSTVAENSVGFQTKKALPSGLQEMNAEFSVSESYDDTLWQG